MEKVLWGCGKGRCLTVSMVTRANTVEMVLCLCFHVGAKWSDGVLCACSHEPEGGGQVSVSPPCACHSPSSSPRYNGTMLVFSAVFLCASLLLTKTFGSVGFILANCINMAARIVHSCYFIQTFFSPTPLRPLLVALPSLPMVMTFVLSFLITAFSEVRRCHQSYPHILIIVSSHPSPPPSGSCAVIVDCWGCACT